MAYVGFRGSDKYDQPGLYGMEVRLILNDDKIEKLAPLLDRIEAGMRTEKYGFNADQLMSWLGGHVNHDLTTEEKNKATADLMSKIWYNHKDLIMDEAHVPASLSSTIKEGLASKKKWQEQIKKNEGLRMLFHDWSMDPLFYKDGAGQKRMLDAQIKALKELFKKPSDDLMIMTRFIYSSGLLGKLEDSFSVKIH